MRSLSGFVRDVVGWEARRYRPATSQNQRFADVFGTAVVVAACQMSIVNPDFTPECENAGLIQVSQGRFMALGLLRKNLPEPAATGPRPDQIQSSEQPAPVAQPAGSDRTAVICERLVEQLSNRIGGLGVELADVAGNLQEVAGRVASQSDRFGHLQNTAETMVAANHEIADASRSVQSAATAAVSESPNRAPPWRRQSSISPH